ncbi:MAG: hypothetical protein FWC27_03075, partial [Firmicutes bacterium]|nr:hypothetical protein [Bacillota bacterium]
MVPERALQLSLLREHLLGCNRDSDRRGGYGGQCRRQHRRGRGRRAPGVQAGQQGAEKLHVHGFVQQ